MSSLFDRLAAWALRLVASGMVFAGISMLVATVPVIGMASGFPMASTVARFLLELTALFIVFGATVTYLSRRRGLLFPNERVNSEVVRSELGGWLIVLAIVLLALPVYLTIRLQPFLAEWGRVADFLGTFDIWSGGSANGSGLILMPLAAVLTPPFFELLAMIGFVVASAILLALLLLRSEAFPRLYLASVILLAAFVISSMRGASAAMTAAQAVQQLVVDWSATPEESAQLTELVSRYSRIVSSTAPVLVWTLLGYAVWIAPLMMSARARTTFVSRPRRVATSGRALDLEAITSPPRFPG
jgi:hypothetical protein